MEKSAGKKGQEIKGLRMEGIKLKKEGICGVDRQEKWLLCHEE